MNMLKLTAAAAIAALSFSASAMTAINDQDLSAVSGQDGVSIAADLNINIGSFTYTDKDGDGSTGATAGGGSVSFNGITVRGLMAMTIDVLTGAQFATAVGASITQVNADLGNTALDAAHTAGLIGAVGHSLGYNATATTPGSDVVQFAFPASGDADAHSVTPTITVGSITTGNNGASFGSIQIKNLDLQGTKVWMFGH